MAWRKLRNSHWLTAGGGSRRTWRSSWRTCKTQILPSSWRKLFDSCRAATRAVSTHAPCTCVLRLNAAACTACPQVCPQTSTHLRLRLRPKPGPGVVRPPARAPLMLLTPAPPAKSTLAWRGCCRCAVARAVLGAHVGGHASPAHACTLQMLAETSSGVEGGDAAAAEAGGEDMMKAIMEEFERMSGKVRRCCCSCHCGRHQRSGCRRTLRT